VHVLQAAAGEVGKVTFQDADAAAEMRQYVSANHVDLRVEVRLQPSHLRISAA
jgi:hypothetical protein